MRGKGKGPTPFGIVVCALSAGFAVFPTIVYLARPDACAALTVFPPGVWLLLGLGLLLLGIRRAARRPVVGVALLWLLFLVLAIEEPRSLLRLTPAPRGTLRIVSLNCAGGNALAAAEVAAYHPDIVLLQESPDRDEVLRLAAQLFGAQAGVAYDLESAILVRGSVVRQIRPRRAVNRFATRALVRLDADQQIDITSLRLAPPIFRMDLWSPSCWRAQTENRQLHRRQLAAIARTLDSAIPTIVGGDFNAPAGDAAMRVLQPGLRDAFVTAGRGWANTMDNDTPVLRIDQVWTSVHYTPVSVTAHRTRHSDHRLVVCDLAWKE
jgi:vancomycin resistance protein VanJ